MKIILAMLLLFAVGAVQAEATPAKKELVSRIIKAQQSSIEAMARSLAERPALLLFQQAGFVLQSRVAVDQREAVGKGIQADLKKYVDEVNPILRERAVKLAPTTIGPLLEARFTEDELKQLANIMESPVSRKYQQLSGELQNALGEKLVSETRSAIEPKVKALELSIAKRLGVTPPAANGSPPKPARQ